MQFWHANELMLMLVVVNGAPVLVGLLARHRLDSSIDGGRIMRDGRRLLGPSKTIRGLLASILAGTTAAPLVDLNYLYGAMFACLSMAGDLGSSFLKRRLGYAPSCARPFLDQLPESLLPLLALQPVLNADAGEILVATTGFIIIDLLLTRLIRPAQPVCK